MFASRQSLSWGYLCELWGAVGSSYLTPTRKVQERDLHHFSCWCHFAQNLHQGTTPPEELARAVVYSNGGVAVPAVEILFVAATVSEYAVSIVVLSTLFGTQRRVHCLTFQGGTRLIAPSPRFPGHLSSTRLRHDSDSQRGPSFAPRRSKDRGACDLRRHPFSAGSPQRRGL